MALRIAATVRVDDQIDAELAQLGAGAARIAVDAVAAAGAARAGDRRAPAGVDGERQRGVGEPRVLPISRVA